MKIGTEGVGGPVRAFGTEPPVASLDLVRVLDSQILGYATCMQNVKTATASASDGDVLEDPTAELFQVFASPIRLAVVRSLLQGERSVTDLMSELNIAQSRLSNHLACLRNCGVVQTRRHANFIYYDIADPRVADMVAIGEALAAPNAQELAHCDVLQQEY